jgi:hypothetical protein
MTTDVEGLIREAIVAIAEANGAFKAVLGRANNLIIEREVFGPGTMLPVLVYDLEEFHGATGEGRLRLVAVADELESSRKCRTILEAAVAGYTTDAFAAQALDVAVFNESRASIGVGDENSVLGAVNREGQPNLAESLATLTLLYLP